MAQTIRRPRCGSWYCDPDGGQRFDAVSEEGGKAPDQDAQRDSGGESARTGAAAATSVKCKGGVYRCLRLVVGFADGEQQRPGTSEVRLGLGLTQKPGDLVAGSLLAPGTLGVGTTHWSLDDCWMGRRHVLVCFYGGLGCRLFFQPGDPNPGSGRPGPKPGGGKGGGGRPDPPTPPPGEESDLKKEAGRGTARRS